MNITPLPQNSGLKKKAASSETDVSKNVPQEKHTCICMHKHGVRAHTHTPQNQLCKKILRGL